MNDRFVSPQDGDIDNIATISVFRHTFRMALKFHGSLQELKDRLLPLNLEGEWEDQPNGVVKFKCRDRAGLLWSQTKGTIWFDGPQKDTLSSKVTSVLNEGALASYIDADSQIFVVHGRDHDTRDQLELVLRRLGLGLEPFILQVTGGGGDTLIEALERMIGKSAHSAFGIVLVTPDDMGYLKTEKPEDAKPRARQNVILEASLSVRPGSS